MNIPNMLTIARFILVPVFAYTYLFAGNNAVSAIILAVSAVTDILDGYIARKYNMVTKWGAAFDPIADKLTQITVAFCLAFGGYKVMWLIFSFLVVKELILVLGGIKLYKKGDVVIGANWYGKAATVLFYLVFFVLILFGGKLGDASKYILSAIAIAFSIFAFVRYTALFFGIRKKLFNKTLAK
ncbi:MAG: CDP-alcohol phosphatidyltransferase family protein [Firmicutes bacterium]|nr:CDP-alcohol phosphatidyltransferase family protein [Bacillota bacterium]